MRAHNILTETVGNFRSRKGEFADENLVCYDCGELSEVYYKWMDGTSGWIILCKGCLTRAIEEIDKAILGSVRDRKIEVLDEDDGYPD